MGLFKPKWENANWAKRIKGIERLFDQDILERIAAQDPVMDVRLAAIAKITDDLFLAQLCNAFGYSAISRAALPRIKSNQILVSLAIAAQEGALADTVLARIEGLGDEEAFQAIVAAAKTQRAMQRALKKIESEAFLFQTALAHPDPVIAREAGERVKGADLLRRLAFGAASVRVREGAVQRLDDQDALSQLALGKHEEAVRKAAIYRLKDKDVLYRLVMEDSFASLRSVAMARYADLKEGPDHVDVLVKIALAGLKTDSKLAVRRLVDQDALKRVYRKCKDSDVCEVALGNITDQAFLREIASNDKLDPGLIRIACEGLSYGGKEIAQLMDTLRMEPSWSENWSERKGAAIRLRKLLSENADAADLLWPRVVTRANTPHEDATVHDDNGVSHSRSYDCTHSDFNRHTDTEIGLSFPAHPG